MGSRYERFIDARIGRANANGRFSSMEENVTAQNALSMLALRSAPESIFIKKRCTLQSRNSIQHRIATPRPLFYHHGKLVPYEGWMSHKVLVQDYPRKARTSRTTSFAIWDKVNNPDKQNFNLFPPFTLLPTG